MKRSADKQISKEDPEEEGDKDSGAGEGVEDYGQQGSWTDVSQRKIAKAKRRHAGDAGQPKPFSGFSFGAPAATSTSTAPPAGSAFGKSLGAPSTASLSAPAFGSDSLFKGSTAMSGISTATSSANTFSAAAAASAPSTTATNGDGKSQPAATAEAPSIQLAELNAAFLTWVQGQLTSMKLVDLTPGLRDYIRVSAELVPKIQKNLGKSAAGSSTASAPTTLTAPASTTAANVAPTTTTTSAAIASSTAFGSLSTPKFGVGSASPFPPLASGTLAPATASTPVSSGFFGQGKKDEPISATAIGLPVYTGPSKDAGGLLSSLSSSSSSSGPSLPAAGLSAPASAATPLSSLGSASEVAGASAPLFASGGLASGGFGGTGLGGGLSSGPATSLSGSFGSSFGGNGFGSGSSGGFGGLGGGLGSGLGSGLGGGLGSGLGGSFTSGISSAGGLSVPTSEPIKFGLGGAAGTGGADGSKDKDKKEAHERKQDKVEEDKKDEKKEAASEKKEETKPPAFGLPAFTTPSLPGAPTSSLFTFSGSSAPTLPFFGGPAMSAAGGEGASKETSSALLTLPAPFSFGSATLTPGASFSPFAGLASFGGAAATPAPALGADFFKGVAKAPADGGEEDDGEGGDEPQQEEQAVSKPREMAEYELEEVKVFFNDGGKWTSIGQGTLMIQEEAGKYRLAVRAITASRKYLLNIFLFPEMPVSAQGDRGVALSCIANPPVKEKCTVCEEPHPSNASNECVNGCFSNEGCKLEDKKGKKPAPTSYALKVPKAPEAKELLAKLTEYKGKSPA